MTKQSFLEFCLNTYGTSPDYPFDEDFETAVLRHADNRKWYALVMRVSRRKFGFDNDGVIDVVNLKLPTEMFGSFGTTAKSSSAEIVKSPNPTIWRLSYILSLFSLRTPNSQIKNELAIPNTRVATEVIHAV